MTLNFFGEDGIFPLGWDGSLGEVGRQINLCKLLPQYCLSLAIFFILNYLNPNSVLMLLDVYFWLSHLSWFTLILLFRLYVYFGSFRASLMRHLHPQKWECFFFFTLVTPLRMQYYLIPNFIFPSVNVDIYFIICNHSGRVDTCILKNRLFYAAVLYHLCVL